MSLYLKYRPQDFESLVWQDFIKKTLRNAIKNNKTVWAYLFCWPRWTWKTSTARIVAKAINCLNPDNWDPCNECKICKAINNESLVDVIEIDAASNTWVDNIRELIEKSHFTPTYSKYKVYIIDEVHMLSKWAFNALLKTLEEPPKYLKFILATTETHKVPDTIISRCQRYDFKSISKEDIKKRLEFISKKENIKIDKDSLDYIINNSWWALRNAINIFEQFIDNWEINYKNISSTLWLVKNEELKSFLDKLLKKDKEIINNYEQLIENWKNIKLFSKELLFYIRDSILEDLKENKDISNKLSIIDILDETISKMKNSIDENTTFTIWILKIINPLSNHFIKTKELNKTETNTIIKEIKKSNTIEKNINTKKEENKKELDINDIWDIFWDTSDTIKNEEKKENNIFDKQKYLNLLKELWVKWMIVASIKASDFSFNNQELTIKFKTSFVLNQVNSADNIAILNQALEKMWFKDIKIILK